MTSQLLDSITTGTDMCNLWAHICGSVVHRVWLMVFVEMAKTIKRVRNSLEERKKDHVQVSGFFLVSP